MVAIMVMAAVVVRIGLSKQHGDDTGKKQYKPPTS